MRGFCGRRAQKGDVTSLGLFRRRASGVPARPVFRRRRGTAVLVALSIVCFAPFSRYYHALSRGTARLRGFTRQSTRSYGRFSLLAMSVIDQETHIKTSSAAAASPRRRPASLRVSRYVVSKKELSQPTFAPGRRDGQPVLALEHCDVERDRLPLPSPRRAQQ